MFGELGFEMSGFYVAVTQEDDPRPLRQSSQFGVENPNREFPFLPAILFLTRSGGCAAAGLIDRPTRGVGGIGNMPKKNGHKLPSSPPRPCSNALLPCSKASGSAGQAGGREVRSQVPRVHRAGQEAGSHRRRRSCSGTMASTNIQSTPYDRPCMHAQARERMSVGGEETGGVLL